MPEELLQSVGDALSLAMWLSLPPLLAAALAGVLAGAGASLTRLGDASGSSVPKQLAVALCMWLCAGWIGHELWQFTRALWARLGQGP